MAHDSVNKPRVTDEAFCFEGRGPILLLAGPGTGKTYQLAKRIQYLTGSRDVTPDEITVITFTKEAARSMRQKIARKGKPEFVEADKRPGTIATMHSLGHSIILSKPEAVGLADGVLVVESDEMRRVLFVDAALSLDLSFKQGMEALAHRAAASRTVDETSGRIIQRYEEILRKSNWVDYDDQIRLAVQLLQNDQETLMTFSHSARFLLIDEYQDINSDQFDLIKLLAAGNPAGLFVVGDDDQSIYKFRGGSPEFIRKFRHHFGDSCEVLQMKTSRRCPQNILQAANHLVRQYNAGRLQKQDPEYNMAHEGTVVVHDCPSDTREAEIIAALVKHDMQNGTGEKRTAFILVPSRNYLPTIQRTLTRWGINFQIIKDTNESVAKFTFVKKWAENPESNLLARYVIQQVIDGGKTAIPGPMTRGKNFARRIEHLQKIANLWNEVLKVGESLWKIFQDSSSAETLHKEITKTMHTLKLSYETDLGDFLKNMVVSVKAWSSKEKFYEDIRSLGAEHASPTADYEVRILSMQKSKGLEAETVFVVGLEDGSMPRGISEQEIAEGARLIFVAMTRAKENLHIMHSRKREGSATFKSSSHGLKPSAFVTSLPKEHIKKQYHQSQTSKAKKVLHKAVVAK